MNSFIIKTFGCKLNQYESQLIRENLLNIGWVEVPNIENADYIIVNTCAVTADSIKGLRKFIKSSNKNYPQARIIAVGCVGEVYSEELENLPLYLILGNKEKEKFPQIISNTDSITDKISYFANHTRAFVKIQDGCNNNCSFCCAGLARGLSHSRNPFEILDEIKTLLGNGYKEIVLTGLCLGDYGKDINYSLSGLLKEIQNLNFDFRIRLSSIELQDITEELINIMTDSNKLAPHLHIPLQSGSDKILKLMNRKYSSDNFRNTVLKLRREIENFQFSTDVIIGFPQETEADFENTIELLKFLRPIRVHIFPFSPRPKTLAYNFKRIPEKIVYQRKKIINDEVNKIVACVLKEQIGKEMKVLFENKLDGKWLGYSENYFKVGVKYKSNLKNELLPVVVKGVDKLNHLLLAHRH